MTKRSPFKYFETSLEIIRLAVMMMWWTPTVGIDVPRQMLFITYERRRP